MLSLILHPNSPLLFMHKKGPTLEMFLKLQKKHFLDTENNNRVVYVLFLFRLSELRQQKQKLSRQVNICIYLHTCLYEYVYMLV